MKFKRVKLRARFFNPLKIGAYKILPKVIWRVTVFFNPLKIGAYKMS